MISNWWHQALTRKPSTFRREKNTVQPHRFRPLLELLEDRNLMTTFLVFNVNEDGVGSLRQAILDANAAGGPDEIKFEIPVALGTTIQLTSATGALDTITDQVTIDGANKFGGNIELTSDGNFSGNGLTLTTNDQLNASDSIIRGLIINGFDGDGIFIDFDVNRVRIEGNFIGTDALGTTAVPNTGNGISIFGNDNTIGGTGEVGLGASLGNLISGNLAHGILIDGPGFFSGSASVNNQVQGNFIGTDILGQADLGNGGNGVTVVNSPLNLIGGSSGAGVFFGNLISGNGENGIEIEGSGATENLVQGNFIGTALNGADLLPNTKNGVHLIAGASRNTIGGDTAAEGNLISGNQGDGILIDASGGRASTVPTQFNVIRNNFIGTDVTGQFDRGNLGNGVAITNGVEPTTTSGFGADFNTIGGARGLGNLIVANGGAGVLVGTSADDNVVNNTIVGNSIFANGKLGIDLGGKGVTLNDQGDPDGGTDAQTPPGPNFFQNFPTLLSAVINGPDVTIVFTIDDFAPGLYRIEFFANDPPVSGVVVQGQIFLGFGVFSNTPAVPEVFTFTIAGGASFNSRLITATATALVNDGALLLRSTSEFSNVVEIPIIPVPPIIVDPPIDNDPIIVDILEGDPPPPTLLPIFVVTFQTFSISAVPPPPTLRQVKVLTPLVPDKFQNLVDAPGEIHGQILDDPNALGKAGPDTFPLHGQPVFLDFNRNGEYDDGEPITVTNAKGEYTFTSLTSGQYTVHLLLGRAQDITFGPKQDNKVELRSGSMIITNVNFGVRFRARRRPGSRTALPWHTDGVLLAAGSVSPGAAEQYGLDSLPLVQGQPALEEPAAADSTPPIADSDSPASGLFRWCGWLLGAAVLAPWQQLASRRKSKESRRTE